MSVKWKILETEIAEQILKEQSVENTIHSGRSLHAWDDIFVVNGIAYKAEGTFSSEHVDVYEEEE